MDIPSPLLQAALERLTRATLSFLALGVAVIDDSKPSKDRSPVDSLYSPHTLRSFLRHVAKEQDRPFVYVQIGMSDVELHIPKQKRLNVLGAGLRIVAEPTTNRWAHHSDILMINRSSETEFVFRHGGIEVFNSWIRQCNTDPIFKIALKK